LEAPDFDLGLTLNSGQVFHWRRRGEGWLGMIGGEACYAEQRGEVLMIGGVEAEVARRYFALDHPMGEIFASFPRDEAMAAALATGRGLRVLRQPWWECVATFITSAQKAVPHIAQISHTLRGRFGRRVEWGGETLFGYPEPGAIAALEEGDLRACALGYRARNLLKCARQVAEGRVDLAAIAELPDRGAHAALCELGGVGPKVANCVLLFAYERLGAFPIDVWIERVLRVMYFAGKRKVTAERLAKFAGSYFGAYGGYAQQFLFHHARTVKLGK
jgi:N-glycosylase/DNA lyase